MPPSLILPGVLLITCGSAFAALPAAVDDATAAAGEVTGPMAVMMPESWTEEYAFIGRVTRVQQVLEYAGQVVVVDPIDARWAVEVHVVLKLWGGPPVRPSDPDTVAYLVHSPTLFFGPYAPGEGQEYVFTGRWEMDDRNRPVAHTVEVNPGVAGFGAMLLWEWFVPVALACAVMFMAWRLWRLWRKRSSRCQGT